MKVRNQHLSYLRHFLGFLRGKGQAADATSELLLKGAFMCALLTSSLLGFSSSGVAQESVSSGIDTGADAGGGASGFGALPAASQGVGSQVDSSTGAESPNLSPTGGERFQGSRFRTTVGVRAGYDNNVYTESENSDNEESMYTGASASFLWNFGTQRTQLTLGLNAGADYYTDVSDDDIFYSFGLNFGVTHSLTPRLSAGFTTTTSYQSQPDFSIAFANTRQSGDYLYSSNRLFFSYLWTPKFQTVTGYTLGLIFYEDDFLAETGDRLEHTINQEFRYLWTPTSTLVAEYRLGFANFQDEIGDDNYSHFALLGLDHQLAPRSSISTRLGAQYTDYDSGDSAVRPYGEFSLTYQAGQYTSLSWYNRLSIEQSELGGLNERYTYRTGLNVGHRFTARLSGNLGVYYSHDEYDGAAGFDGFSEDAVDVTTSLSYLFTRLFSASVGYQYSGVLNSSLDRDYDRNKVFLSLSTSF
jgi:hypothetical protein